MGAREQFDRIKSDAGGTRSLGDWRLWAPWHHSGSTRPNREQRFSTQRRTSPLGSCR